LNHKEYQIIDYDYRKEFMKWCNSNIGQNCHNMNLENSYKEPIEVVLDCFMKNIIIPYSKINSTPVIKVEPDENKPSYNNKNIINEEYNTIQLDNTTTKLISSSEPKRIYIDYNLSKSTIPFEEKEKDKKMDDKANKVNQQFPEKDDKNNFEHPSIKSNFNRNTINIDLILYEKTKKTKRK